MTDWKIFQGDAAPHDRLAELPDPPPWRFGRAPRQLRKPSNLDLSKEARRAAPFLPSPEMVTAVNAGLYLRRPLLLTGQPGTGKSTLISKVAHELKLGPVLRWPANSRSTVRGGVYEYDAVGRLQEVQAGEKNPRVEGFLKLGPLGTALMADGWPRPLLIDEIDKSDLDFANDLLNVIEEGEYEIPELRRLGESTVQVRDFLGEHVFVKDGRLVCGQFPFVVMTSNAEREFPAPFLRRCVRLHINPPTAAELASIVSSHLGNYSGVLNKADAQKLIDEFDLHRKANADLSTDQLLNAVFLTVAVRDGAERSFDDKELDALKATLLRQLSGPAA